MTGVLLSLAQGRFCSVTGMVTAGLVESISSVSTISSANCLAITCETYNLETGLSSDLNACTENLVILFTFITYM